MIRQNDGVLHKIFIIKDNVAIFIMTLLVMYSSLNKILPSGWAQNGCDKKVKMDGLG